jgi:hypothetical protein
MFEMYQGKGSEVGKKRETERERKIKNIGIKYIEKFPFHHSATHLNPIKINIR